MATIKIEQDKVFIQNGGRWAQMGSVSKDGKVFSTYRNSSKHLMRKLNAYGFNRQLMEAGEFEYIHLETDHGNYLIPRKEIILGQSYRAPNYDTQVFIGREALEQYKLTDSGTKIT